MSEARLRNARLRDIGTRNLILASLRAGVRRLVAQSIAFAYRPGIVRPDETAPLDPEQQGVISLERQVLEAPLDGVVLRYGRFYGPGTGFDSNDRPASVHVDAAAEAALLALTRGHGIYNIAEDDGEVAIDRARAELGWSPDFRIG
jgi:nucleoside-diphosphate-sugar epimerase